jgi:hypothetical protein
LVVLMWVKEIAKAAGGVLLARSSCCTVFFSKQGFCLSIRLIIGYRNLRQDTTYSV